VIFFRYVCLCSHLNNNLFATRFERSNDIHEPKEVLKTLILHDMSSLRLTHLRDLMHSEMFRSALKMAAMSAGVYYGTKLILYACEHCQSMDQKTKKVLDKLQVKESLNKYECMIANNLIDLDTLTVTWDDIAGMESIRQQIFAEVIFPLKSGEVCKGSYLFQPTKGTFWF
jgi:SpoVK/Ycf46/Vps4 family AAA+-type ATPase